MIAIVGGGPAGIALGLALDGRSVAYTLFEQATLGATWRMAPDDLKVLSPWWTNVLCARDLLRCNPFAKVPAATYLKHLVRTASRLRGTVFEGARVQCISRDPEVGWNLETSLGVHGPFDAVVVATGYFSSPAGPDPPIVSDGSVKILHSADIRSYDQLNIFAGKAHKVFVVGGRVTAGQTVLALVDRGIECALCTRSPLRFRRHGLLAWFREMAYYLWEEIEAACSPGIRRDSYPSMEGGRNKHLVESEAVQVHPPITEIGNGRLLFADGTSLPAAGVILATGYLPSLAIQGLESPLDLWGLPVSREFEVANLPGVFLLGFDNLYDHRSRYLRGIRIDAQRLARRLHSDHLRRSAATAA